MFCTFPQMLNLEMCDLSYTFRSNGEKNPRVKHYQIRQTETELALFYLAEKYLFSTIPELILYHQHNAAGKLCDNDQPLTCLKKVLTVCVTCLLGRPDYASETPCLSRWGRHPGHCGSLRRLEDALVV